MKIEQMHHVAYRCHDTSTTSWENKLANKLLRRVQFHDTPKHASWLNMAEVEIGILSRQCLDWRVESRHRLQCEVDARQQARNTAQRTIEWSLPIRTRS